MSAHILVVDDVPLNVEVLVAMLAHDYPFVSTAADGFEALAKIEAEKPDIVLLDVMMPGLDGFDTCRRIKADPATAHIPVVMVTALSDVDDLVRGFESGANDFLTKPVNFRVLMARVDSQLRQKWHYDRILEQSMVDPLTGAFNCRYVEAHVPRLIARCRAARKPVAVLMIDVDHFKRINDEHGHPAGNHVLKEIVNRATSALRPSDLMARMGGEEFAVVMPEADLNAALQIAERLRSRIEDTPVEGATITVSVGAAVVRPDGEKEELDATLRRADAALYGAKRAGRNRVIADGGGEPPDSWHGLRLLDGVVSHDPDNERRPEGDREPTLKRTAHPLLMDGLIEWLKSRCVASTLIRLGRPQRRLLSFRPRWFSRT
jgi:two-component system cell cycle response regulator